MSKSRPCFIETTTFGITDCCLADLSQVTKNPAENLPCHLPVDDVEWELQQAAQALEHFN